MTGKPEMDEEMALVLLTLGRIKNLVGKRRGIEGNTPCIREGCKGKVKFSVASINGHVHAACTKCSIRFME